MAHQIIDKNGVKIIAFSNLATRVPVPASKVYSTNLLSLIEEFWDTNTKDFVLNLEDEIIRGCLLTYNGQIINPALKK